MSIGKRLLQARKSKGFTQEALANEIGVSRGVIFNIEKQLKADPQPIVIEAICNVLGINKEWLLSGNGPMEPANESIQLLAELRKECATLSDTEIKYLLNTIRIMKEFERDLSQSKEPTQGRQNGSRNVDDIIADIESRKDAKPPGTGRNEPDRGR